ncbi:MAG: archaetidylserine decarboxylase [Pseudomonadota bacterium]
MNDSSLRDRLFVALQKWLPTRGLSVLMYRLTRIQWPALKNLHIRLFMRGFNISLEEAELTEPTDYPTFNDFFTRALKPGVRPISSDAQALASPVDGTISQLGLIQQGEIVQAKGHRYTVSQLLGGDPERAAMYDGGSFCTIYLAPYNYHRIHMPVDGLLREWIHVPGRLFSVNPATVRELPGVFALNERVVSCFNHPRGPWALVMVGALFVGSMETVWAGQVTPPYRHGNTAEGYQSQQKIMLRRGDEMGRFNMGSTVILLFPRGMASWDPGAQPQSMVRMGQTLGRVSARP